jgi:hypothetical protein
MNAPAFEHDSSRTLTVLGPPGHKRSKSNMQGRSSQKPELPAQNQLLEQYSPVGGSHHPFPLMTGYQQQRSNTTFDPHVSINHQVPGQLPPIFNSRAQFEEPTPTAVVVMQSQQAAKVQKIYSQMRDQTPAGLLDKKLFKSKPIAVKYEQVELKPKKSPRV